MRIRSRFSLLSVCSIGAGACIADANNAAEFLGYAGDSGAALTAPHQSRALAKVTKPADLSADFWLFMQTPYDCGDKYFRNERFRRINIY